MAAPSDYSATNHVSTTSSSSTTAVQDASAHQLRHLTTRVQALYSQHRDSTESLLISAEEQAMLAMRWQHLVKELDKLPEERLTSELLHDFVNVLQQCQHFAGMTFSSEEKWLDFMRLQEIISNFYDKCARVKKRSRDAFEEMLGNMIEAHATKA
jgi:hypothetical protein